MNKFQRAINKIKTNGITSFFNRSLVTKIIERKIVPLKYKHDKMYIIEYPLNKVIKEVKSEVEIEVKLADFQDFKFLITHRKDRWFTAKAVKRRFNRGDICFIGVVDGKAVCCLWATFCGKVGLPEVEYELKLESNIIGLIDGYTLPEYRGLKIYAKTWNSFIDFLKKKHPGEKVYGFVPASNIRSSKVHKKLNLDKVVMTVELTKFLGFKRHRIVKL